MNEHTPVRKSRSTQGLRLVVVAGILLFLFALPAVASAASGKPVVSTDRRGSALLSHDICEEGCDDSNPLNATGDARLQVATRRAHSVRVAIWTGKAWSASVALRRKGRPQTLPCGGGVVKRFPIRGCKFAHWYVKTEDPRILNSIRDWSNATQGFEPPLLIRACGAGGCTYRRIRGSY